MRVTSVEVKLHPHDPRLVAFAEIVFDNAFAVKELKLLAMADGFLLAFPSRLVTDHCTECGGKAPVIARFCHECGARRPNPPPRRPAARHDAPQGRLPPDQPGAPRSGPVRGPRRVPPAAGRGADGERVDRAAAPGAPGRRVT